MNELSERYFVIGDTFAGTARNLPGALTETEALDKVHSTAVLDRDVYLYTQQGVDFRSLSAAVNAFNASIGPTGNQFHLSLGSCAPRATRRLAHKARAENIIISAPRRIDEDSFEMDLCFSSHNEFFLDHMTGMHIQGIVLIEAARQAFLAVTEAFYLEGDQNDYYFVIKSMDTSYASFVFPFDATLRYVVTRAAQKENRHSFDAEIEIVQADTVCTSVKVSFTAFEAAAIAKRELDVARGCMSKLLALYATVPLANGALSVLA